METLPDVQGSEIASSFILSRVGIQGLKRPVRIVRPGKEVVLIPTFDISVNLPAEQKGSHMSRHVEVIHRAVDQAIDMKNDSVEKLVERIANELLRSHEYATYADVKLKADYFMNKVSPDERDVTENYRLFAEARIERDGKQPWRSIGVEVFGMSACPCAMENVRVLLKERLKEQGHEKAVIDVLDMIPVPTHNQQNRGFIQIGMEGEMEIEAEDLISLVERNLSSPTYEILKRKGEAEIVLDAHENPKFVEDIVRDIIDSFLSQYTHLPDDGAVSTAAKPESHG